MARNGVKTGGGSRKGKPNKVYAYTRELLWEYITAQQEQGKRSNPYEVLVDTMLTTEDGRLAVQCAKELATYLLPRLASVQLQGDTDHPLTVYHVELE